MSLRQAGSAISASLVFSTHLGPGQIARFRSALTERRTGTMLHALRSDAARGRRDAGRRLSAPPPWLPSGRGWIWRFLNPRPRAKARERLVCYPYREGLTLGCSPALTDIEDLVREKGLRSLVNLNTEGESDETLSPNVEASWAHALDLRHERVSFSADLPRGGDVDLFLRLLESIPRPAFVHSRHGSRAAAMIIVHLGLELEISGAAAVLAAEGLGISCPRDSLRRFAEAEVDRRMGAT